MEKGEVRSIEFTFFPKEVEGAKEGEIRKEESNGVPMRRGMNGFEVAPSFDRPEGKVKALSSVTAGEEEGTGGENGVVKAGLFSKRVCKIVARNAAMGFTMKKEKGKSK